MSLSKDWSLNKRGDEYIGKVFFGYKQLNPGDSIEVIITKDGEATSQKETVVAGQMMDKRRFYIVVRTWKEEPQEEEIIP